MLPLQRNKELWIGQIHQSRQRFFHLQNKYFGIKKLITADCANPLSAMMSQSVQYEPSPKNAASLDTPNLKQAGKDLAEASKLDIEITTLIKKDINRTLPELGIFQSSLLSRHLQ